MYGGTHIPIACEAEAKKLLKVEDQFELNNEFTISCEA